MKLSRTIEQWANCDPEVMAEMSPAAIMFALKDAKHDVLAMHAALAAQAIPEAQDVPTNGVASVKTKGRADSSRATVASKEAVTLSDEKISSLPFLSEQDSAALFVFNGQCEDSDADGYTERAEMMDRLAELGVVQRLPGRGRKFGVTAFGSWLIENEFAQEPLLPLRTITEHNAREKAGHALYLKESAPGSTAWVELSRLECESWRKKSDAQRDASKAEGQS